jgi:phosphopentomutase
MVGHSGKLEPTIRAVETVDAQLGRIYQAVKQHNANWIITADHGNAELLIDPVTGGPHTAHTTNPVPFIYVTERAFAAANALISSESFRPSTHAPREHARPYLGFKLLIASGRRSSSSLARSAASPPR